MSNLKSLKKAENAEAYKKLAAEGLMLAHPVKIHGQSIRPDTGMGYHSTIKVFDKQKDHPHSIHNLARHLPLNPPDAKNTQIEPGQFKDRFDNDVYVLKLKGNSADKMKEHNAKFAHMGTPVNYEFTPHISVPKDLHDKIKSSGIKTAHEAGIEFGPAELRAGHKAVKTYHHEADSTEPKVPDQSDMTAKVKVPVAKSEQLDNLEKGALKNAAIGASMLAAAATGAHKVKADTQPAAPKAPTAQVSPQPSASPAPTPVAPKAPISPISPKIHAPKIKKPMASKYDHQRMLRAIAQVESSNNPEVKHGEGGGAIHGHEHAYGRYGLMPETIRETIKGHRDLKQKYAKAMALKGVQLHRFMHDNKGLEDVIADRHLSHMEHVLGQIPENLGYGWLNGTEGALKAKKAGEDIKNHWHARKIRRAYDTQK